MTYSCSSGYACGATPVATTYLSQTRRITVRFIGCTCGGAGPCRGTCRTPMPE